MFIATVTAAYLCLAVLHQYCQIFFSLLVQHTLGPVVKVVLPPLLHIIRGSVASHYLNVDVLHLCPELGSSDSGADCLRAEERALCLYLPKMEKKEQENETC